MTGPHLSDWKPTLYSPGISSRNHRSIYMMGQLHHGKTGLNVQNSTRLSMDDPTGLDQTQTFKSETG